MLSKELRDVRGLAGGPGVELPPHLSGLPPCLHKYGPLFAEQIRQEDESGLTSAA